MPGSSPASEDPPASASTAAPTSADGAGDDADTGGAGDGATPLPDRPTEPISAAPAVATKPGLEPTAELTLSSAKEVLGEEVLGDSNIRSASAAPTLSGEIGGGAAARATVPAQPPPPPVQASAPAQAPGSGDRDGQRADPTALMDAEGPDMTQIVHSRASGALPRRPGVLGDLRYVLTALFGGIGLRRRRARIEHRIAVQQRARAALVTVMAREAVATEVLMVSPVAKARVDIAAIDAERSVHTQAAAEADAARRLREEVRDADVLTAAAEVAGLEAEIEHIEYTLAPLSEQLDELRRQSRAALVEVRRLEKRIRGIENKLGTAEPEAQAGLQAELAGAQAEREAAIQREPAIQRQLSALLPEVEALTSRRSDCQAQLLVARDRASSLAPDAEESLATLRQQREQAEAEAASCDERVDDVYRALGEQLVLERPHRPAEAAESDGGAAPGRRHAGQLFSRLLAIDRCDETIAELERQSIEASDVLQAIDRGAVFRGGLLALAIALALAAAVTILLSL